MSANSDFPTILRVRSAAKVNLTLDVLSLRADGYHELQSVVHTVGIWDELTFDFSGPAGCSVSCEDAALEGENNLIVKAARKWLSAAQAQGFNQPLGLRVQLQKNIPMGAGLGGGSGNAAATLWALSERFAGVLSPAQLWQVAATVGADVPLFLQGGCLLMAGIGEKISALPPLAGWLVIVQPPEGLSTPTVFRAWDESGRASAVATPGLLEALQQPDAEILPAVATALGNDLATAAQDLGLQVQSLTQMLRQAGALGAQMTGSGSAVFGIFRDERAARSALAAIEEQQINDAAAPRLRFVGLAPFCEQALAPVTGY